jgi:hypothetical protein
MHSPSWRIDGSMNLPSHTWKSGNVDLLIMLIRGRTCSRFYNTLFSSEMFPPNGRAITMREGINTINLINTPQTPRKPLTYEGEAL